MTIRRAMAAIAVGMMCLTVQASADPVLRFGAGQQGSQNYGVNAALAQAISASGALQVTVQSFGGPTAYLPLLNSGEIDMAAVVMPDLGDAVRGSGPFAGMAQENIRLIAALMPSPVGLMVRANSGIESIGDLKGKRVAWGLPQQASLQPYVEGALANGGLSAADVIQVPVASVANGVEALISGNVDAALFALRAGKVVEADSAVGGIRWLPFDKSEEAVARMNAVAPEAYVLHVPADSGVTGAKGEFETMAYDYALVTRAGFDSAAVEAVAKVLKSSLAEIAASNKILGALSQEAVERNYPSLKQHPAAAAVLTSN